MQSLELINNIGQTDSAEAAIAAIKKVFIPLGVRVNYDGDYVILCMNRGRMNFRSPIQYECNGIVLGVANGTITILAIPPRSLSTIYTANYLMSNLAEYEILPASDGTTLTAYYDNYSGEWRLATRSGFNVGDKVWGSRTYLQICRDLCDWDAIIASASKDCSYSFGVHHTDCHPFSAGTPNSMWHVSTINRNSGEQTSEMLFPPQQRLSVAPTNARESKALFSRLIKDNMEALDKAPANIHYGWILHRGRSGPDHNNDNILLESELAKFIRVNCYDFPRVDSRNNVHWRAIYTTLRAYLRPSFSKFLELFPNYEPTARLIRAGIADLAAEIIDDTPRAEVISSRGVFIATAKKDLSTDRKNSAAVRDYIESVNNLGILTDIFANQ